MDINNPSTSSPPPSAARLWRGVAAAIAVAAVLLVLFVLPAEYGIDVTGAGNALGLNQLAAAPTKTIAVTDNIGGNDQLREVAIPDAGEPTPLPNPAVFQNEATPPETRVMQVVIPPEGETEVKVKMQAGKVVVFSWQTDQGKIYVDHHGHDPSFGPDFFVRYVEEQETAGGNGSLTAPFAGEHGWYWLNFNEFPVTVTLTVTGYFDFLIDYGIF
jgi:hypothetical protein